MARHTDRKPLRRAPLAAAALVACLIAAVAVFAPRGQDDGQTPVARQTSSPAATSTAAPDPTTAADPTGPTWAPTTPNPKIDGPAEGSGALPVSVSIPKVQIASDLITLGTDPATGVLVPPEQYDIAGWFADGSVPGEVGPAVIAGHVDSKAGPGVFYRLKDVAVGDAIMVTLTDGSVVSFTAVKVSDYPKTGFPTADVYGPTPGAELRLITCGGAFDSDASSYLDNIVVFAERT